MIRILKNYSEELPALTIHLDELKHVCEVLSEGGRCVYLLHADTQYDSIAELIEDTKKTTIYQLVIICTQSRETTTALLNVKLDTTIGLVFSTTVIFNPFFVAFANVAALPIVLLFVVLRPEFKLYPLFIILFASIFYISSAASMLQLLVGMRAIKRNVIVLKYKAEYKSFWQVNRDKWAAKAIEWAILLALGGIVTMLSTRGCSSSVSTSTPIPNSTPSTIPATSQPASNRR
jgi:hypothetical protein